MKKIFPVLLLLLINIAFSNLQAQNPTFSSSNLPILVINTNGGTIVDEPKITATMGIIDNGEGNINYITDPFNGYDGFIGVEIRGFSSSGWTDKKPYGFETRDELGDNNNVSLLGMPEENDWVLHAPQADKTLIRNKFIYDLAREMGGYAADTRFCELVINGDYRGVYVLAEKIKRDKNRVDIDKNKEENITGGYLLEMTPNDRIDDDEVFFETKETEASILIKYPDEDDITNDQLNYINNYFDEFETALFGDNFSDEIEGYSKYIDLPSFIDHILLSECFHQLDGLSASQYFHKNKDGKLIMGPVWDFNRSMGNVGYYDIYEYDMWWMLNPRGDKRVPYVNRLMEDANFMNLYATRWFELREDILNTDNINQRIDDYVNIISEAKDRNFERWPDMLETSFSQVYVYDNYDAYITQIKEWTNNKFNWLDNAFEEHLAGVIVSDDNFTAYEFNEQTDNFTVQFDLSPQNENMDGVFGVTDISEGIDGFSDLAVISRFNEEGEIDARFGGNYTNDVAINYNVNEYYHVIMDINMSAKTYDVFITLQNTGEQIQIASNYAFRSEQSSIGKMNGFVLKSSEGSYKIKNFCLNNECDTSLSITENEISNTDFKSYPNPFSEATIISLNQGENSLISIDVYNIQGKKITQIFEGELSKGIHQFKWEGTDENGKKMPNGIYFCRLSTNKSTNVIKIIKL